MNDSKANLKAMSFSQLVTKAQGKYQRCTARYLCKRPFDVRLRTPIISFTFDDFPRSALLTGGRILQSFGLAGTYYASLGLMGKQAPTGEMFLPEDLKAVAEQEHELGCHTFGHCHAWDTHPHSFEQAINENCDALSTLLPGASFKTLSYPIGVPRARTKHLTSKYFECSRGGGQAFNSGTVDLNYLSAYFLEKTRDTPDKIKRMIDANREANGWLIFATHDVCEQPTRFGCVPKLFEDIVKYSIESGAQILPVFKAYEIVRFRLTTQPAR
ncbi:MAG TPA: polysaccharide deacetylase family protein [Terriglobales bacterium]|jgi:peptidoglycan/xylan/chitin deacetylase (PgdA/CDA1 family)|nr:polysaccharide deacetylase family protein [Terriglobales bacterium]